MSKRLTINQAIALLNQQLHPKAKLPRQATKKQGAEQTTNDAMSHHLVVEQRRQERWLKQIGGTK